MAFFNFTQNNSGGSFDFDAKAGITHHVIIEAATPAEANARAEAIGLYFDGCEAGIDCDCCGDRWYAAWGEGDSEPMVYGQPAFSAKNITRWMAPNTEVFVHYADGRIVGEEAH